MLEIIIGSEYTPVQLQDAGMELKRFYSGFSLYSYDGQMYFFRHKLVDSRPVFVLKEILSLPEDRECYTQYEYDNNEIALFEQALARHNSKG